MKKSDNKCQLFTDNGEKVDYSLCYSSVQRLQVLQEGLNNFSLWKSTQINTVQYKPHSNRGGCVEIFVVCNGKYNILSQNQ